MKRKIIGITLLIIFALALTLFACQPKATSSHGSGIAAPAMQITPTPPVEDRSEIGSTDGIFIMGIVIVIITSVPFLFLKTKK